MQSKCRVGIDLVYMPRFNDKLDNDQFLKKILGDNELKIYRQLTNQRRKLEFLSGRFACKEAYAKALKLGIGLIDFKDFEVVKDDNNAPYALGVEASISISHDNEYVIAIVMLGDESE